MKKIKLYFGIAACIFSLATTFTTSLTVYAASNEPNIEVYSDILEWIYKEENGKLYKRLYNYTEGHWEGDWIYVCDLT